jgi:rod shape determining protein RodA
LRQTTAIDWALVLPALLLSLSGLVYIYSAAWIPPDPPGPYFGKMFVKQALFLVAALLVFQFVRRINWGSRPASYWFVLGPAALLLLLVLLIGHTNDTGAKSWISLGPVDMQPSEFAKLAFILSLAWLYSDDAGVGARHFRAALGALLLLLVLVLAQPDLGTSLVFVFTFFVVGALAGVARHHLLALGLSFALLAVPGWFVAKEYQKNRIYAFLHPNPKDPMSDPKGFGYQYKQSLTAIGSGGLLGKGFLRGTQVQRNLVPVVESDFIFALIGEEFGFAGCVWVLLLLFLLLSRLIALAQLANTAYERLICYGASATILCHVLIAVGMTIRLTPITGLPLPFVSYGGSALLTMWVLIAMCQAVYSNTRQSLVTQRRVFFQPR